MIPSYAAWFELGRVHEIELRALGDLIDSQDSAKV